jgi:DNA-binding transcriptional ArsR family regulator
VTNENCILAFAALAQSTRLEAFKLLVAHEPDGLPAGTIADALAVPHNTLSTHLSILSRAQLVKAKRYSRSVVYRANLTQLQQLIGFFLTDCCGGKPELCAPLLQVLAPCCSGQVTTGEI